MTGTKQLYSLEGCILGSEVELLGEFLSARTWLSYGRSVAGDPPEYLREVLPFGVASTAGAAMSGAQDPTGSCAPARGGCR